MGQKKEENRQEKTLKISENAHTILTAYKEKHRLATYDDAIIKAVECAD